MEYLVTIGDYSKQVLQHMYELQKKGIVCDAGLECKDGMVYVHKLILMASDSTYLQSQVTLDGSKNAKRCYVDLNEFSLKTVYDLVKTLYTGEIRVLHENLMELYELCTFLHMEKLRSELQKLVDNDINSGETSKNKDKTTNQNEEVGRNVPIFEARIVQSDSEHPINIQVIKVEPNQEEFSIVDSTCDIHDDSHHGKMDHNNESLKLDKTPIVKGKTLKRTGSTKVLSKSSKKRKVSYQSRGESSDDENLDDLSVSDMGNVSELLNIAKQLSDDGTRGIVKCDHCQKVLTSEYGDLQRGVCQDCLILYSKDVQEPKTEKKKITKTGEMSGNTAEDKEGEPHLLVDPTSIKTEHSGKRIYTCPKCKHTTKHRTGMFRHRKYCEQNLTNQCKVCDKKFADNYSLKQHHKVKHEEGLVCPHCSKTFRSRQGLDYHLKTAVGEFKYKCEKCEKTFVSKQHFNGHMNTHKNTNCRPYECKDCNKYFAYKSTLEVHIDSCHNKKEYKCTTCDMVFFSKSSLTNHREGKHGEKVRRCEVCWKQFKWAASYYRHIKIHNE